MIISEESSKKTYEPIKPGTYLARCVGVYDVGDQYDKFNDRYRRNIILQFELPTVQIEVNGEKKPRLVSRTYTLSTNEKATFRKHLEGWLGANPFPIDTHKLVGLPCMIKVENKTSKTTGKVRDEINTIIEPMDGVPVPDQVTPSCVFDIDGDNAFEEVEKIPAWIADKVKESPSWQMVKDKKDLENFSDVQGGELPF